MQRKKIIEDSMIKDNAFVCTKTCATCKELWETKIDALEKAVGVAKKEMDRRLEDMNQFRDQLKDQAGTFLSKNEHNLYREKVDADIRILRESKAAIDGKASAISAYIAIVMSVVGIIISAISVIIHILIK